MLTGHQWKYLLILFVAVDILTACIILYLVAVSEDSNIIIKDNIASAPTATYTVTPWAGAGMRNTPTATLPPTTISTRVLAESGFPPGFTPTPRPTRVPFYISIPYIQQIGRSTVNVPVINQTLYPEPFFPPGTNNACGPVSLYAGLLGLGLNVDYRRISDIAVSYGFATHGISRAGIINTTVAINYEMGSPFVIESGNRYNVQGLIKELRRGGVLLVLLSVYKTDGQYYVTSDRAGAIGHFLLVERINLRSKRVYFAGSTLGMADSSLEAFISSWTGNTQPISDWQSYLNNEPSTNWAVVIKKRPN